MKSNVANITNNNVKKTETLFQNKLGYFHME